MSSDSEDFQSADEGSDADIPHRSFKNNETSLKLGDEETLPPKNSSDSSLLQSEKENLDKKIKNDSKDASVFETSSKTGLNSKVEAHPEDPMLEELSSKAGAEANISDNDDASLIENVESIDLSSNMKRAISKEQNTENKNQKGLPKTEESAFPTDKDNSNKVKAKPAKIGLKKPREKLGERLGSKKLGVRPTKPLVGLGSQSFQADAADMSDPVAPTNCENEKIQKQKQTQDHQELWQNADENSEKQSDGWNSWGGWGTSLLTAASTITREVGRGMETVMETVEGTLGAPDPSVIAEEAVRREKEALQEEHAAVNKENSVENSSHDKKDSSPSENQPTFGFGGFGGLGSLVSNVSGALETASNKVLLGSLDTLELIGRKTMDVLQEGDPHLANKRSFLTKGRPTLSRILEEARIQNTKNEDSPAHGGSPTHGGGMKQVSLLQIWDATEGPAHFEALSLIMKQCQSRTHIMAKNLSPLANDKWLQLTNKIKACSELQTVSSVEEVEDFSEEIETISNEISLPLNFTKLISSWSAFQKFVKYLNEDSSSYDSKDVELCILERDLYTATAGMMSQVVGILHKAAEVGLITPDLEVLNEAIRFQKLCSCISQGLEKVSDEVCESVTSKDSTTQDAAVDKFITNIYLQMAEGNDLLEQSLKHLVTVFVQVQTKELAELT